MLFDIYISPAKLHRILRAMILEWIHEGIFFWNMHETISPSNENARDSGLLYNTIETS